MSENVLPALLKPWANTSETHYMLPIIDLYREMQRLAHREFDCCDRDTNGALERLMSIDKKKIEIFRERCKDCESQKKWSAYETLAQYIASTSGILLGAGLLSSAPIAGVFLIAGGGLGLANRVFSDAVGWNCIASRVTASKELQRKYAERIDLCFIYLSTAMAMAGTAGAYHASALTRLFARDPRGMLNKTVKIWTLAGTSLQIIAKIGKAWLDQNIGKLNSDIIKFESDSVSARQEIHATSANLWKILELSEKIGECIKDCIAASET